MPPSRWFLRSLMGSLVLAAAACSGSTGGDDDGGGAGSAITVVSDAAFVAFQDGPSAPWVAMQGSVDQYTATASSSQYAIAVACGGISDQPTTTVYFRTTSDPELLTSVCSYNPASTVPVTVEVDGAPAGSTSSIYLGDLFTTLLADTVSSTLHPAFGTSDVLARIAAQPGVDVPYVFYRAAGFNLNQTMLTGIVIEDDFAKPPELHGLSVNATDASEALAISTSYKSPLIQSTWSLLSTPVLTGDVLTYATIDASQRTAGDLTLVTATSTHTADGLVYTRQADLALATPVDSIALGLPDGIPGLGSLSLDKSTDPRLTFAVPATTLDGFETDGFVTDYQAIAFTLSETRLVTKIINMSASAATGLSSVTATSPDLSGVPGWTPDMGLDPTVPLHWQVQRRAHDPGSTVFDGYHSFESSISSQYE